MSDPLAQAALLIFPMNRHTINCTIPASHLLNPLSHSIGEELPIRFLLFTQASSPMTLIYVIVTSVASQIDPEEEHMKGFIQR